MRILNRAFLIFLFFQMFCLNAQTAYFAIETENLEKLAESPVQKHDALVRLARLYQLSGNREKAAELWMAGALSEPGKQDNRALLEALKLFISLGEYDRASTELRTILGAGQNDETVQAARYLSAQLDAFRNGNPAALSQLSENPGYAELRSSIFYTLWRTTNDVSWKTKLLESYPKSPEAELVKYTEGRQDNPVINAAATAQWILFPGRENLELAASAAAPGTAAPAAAAPVAGVPNSAAPAPAVPNTGAVPAAAILQTGLFGREENAKTMAERLSRAGFKPEIIRRQVNGNEYWAVNVLASDVNLTLMELKNAGFESFPVY